MKTEDTPISTESIKKEFQLERMIIFSDAVFAIVITLMAIEIRIPETGVKLTAETLPDALLHLLPVIFAYCVSFLFIGVIWYQHLKMFGLLKDYDKGLVIRNMTLLFFIGLFPFCASLLTKAKGVMMAVLMYWAIILICMLAQFILYRYILVQKPQLRINAAADQHFLELKKRKIAVIGFGTTGILIIVTYLLIPDPESKNLATLWMAAFAFTYKFATRRLK
jgi:uncharacterized membrane protein